MANFWEKIAGATSIALRLSTFFFLRWIPGHHFPQMIIPLLLGYLSVVVNKYEAFEHPKLHQLFPTLFSHEEVIDSVTGEKQEVDIAVYEEEPAFYEDEHPFLKVLLCGIPDWREAGFSYLTIGTNILMAVMTLDLVFRGPYLYPGDDLRFTRVGFVDSNTVKILIREPDSSQLPIYTYYKTENQTSWSSADRLYYAGSETDYTRSIEITGLYADTPYSYTTSNQLNGTFRTAPSIGSPASNTLTFLTSSCIKANFPYNPFSHSLSIHGFSYLSELITSLRSPPAFMLFLGDFIYVDVPQRLASSIEHYRKEYRRVYESPSWNLPGIKSVPWLHTLDDHEIANDWSGGNTTSPFPEASDPFIHYHVSVNPPVPPQAPSSSDTNTTYFQFTRGPASFFLLDTRRYRTDPEPIKRTYSSTKPLYGSSSTSSNPTAASQHSTMLGSSQLHDLLRFLAQPERPGVYWKIIASSVPFTKNWRFGTSDTWGGFPHERSIILDAMHKAEANLGIRIIVLSGDRHEFAAIRYPKLLAPRTKAPNPSTPAPPIYDQSPQSGPHEFSVGPLSMFYLPIRTFRQVDDEDVALAYFPDGNSKIGMVEIGNFDTSSTTGAKRYGKISTNDGMRQKSWLKYSLWIDGAVAWEYMLVV